MATVNSSVKPRYQGWANWETWNAHLWITNEFQTYSYWQRLAEDAVSESDTPEGARIYVAERLKEEFGSYVTEFIECHCNQTQWEMMADFITSAWEEIDWNELASSFCDEVEVPEVRYE